MTGLDVLVDNAGIAATPGVAGETEDAWQRIIGVNQTGGFLGMRAAVPSMLRAGGGSIINTFSIWGVVGTSGYIAYQASKARS